MTQRHSRTTVCVPKNLKFLIYQMQKPFMIYVDCGNHFGKNPRTFLIIVLLGWGGEVVQKGKNQESMKPAKESNQTHSKLKSRIKGQKSKRNGTSGWNEESIKYSAPYLGPMIEKELWYGGHMRDTWQKYCIKVGSEEICFLFNAPSTVMAYTTATCTLTILSEPAFHHVI